MSEETTPTKVPHVYVALSAIQGELARIGIPKDRENKQQGFMFRSIDAVYATLSPLLVEHKLLMLPRGIEHHQHDRATKSGTALYSTGVTFEFDFVSAVDGSMHTVRTYGEGMDMADKSTNKAQSGAYKYAALLTFGIPLVGEVDADDDAHEPTMAGSAKPIETAPRTKSTRQHTADSAVVTVERQAELRTIGKSLIDMVDDEKSNVSVDHSYSIWELTEPLDQDDLLWVSAYLNKHTRVLTRTKEVMVAARAKKRAAAAANEPADAPLPADF